MLRSPRQREPPAYLGGLLTSPGPQGWQASPLFLLGAHSPPPQLRLAPPGSQRSTGKAGVWAASLQRKDYRGLWPLGHTVGGRGVNGCLIPPQRPGPTLWEPESPSSGPQAAPGSRNTHNLPKLQGQPSPLASGKLPPAKGPQINYSKNRLGCSRSFWAGYVGVEGEPAMGGCPSHTLPLPRLCPRPP